MVKASFEIESCAEGETTLPPAVKLVPITIVGGTFSHCYTGHSTDSTNASFDIEGKTEATLALPIVDGGVWDARVFYSPTATDFNLLEVTPDATHNEDELGVSFHTLRRDRCDVEYTYDEIELPPLPAPENFVVLSGEKAVYVRFDPVEEAEMEDVYILEAVGEELTSSFHRVEPRSNTVELPPGSYQLRVRVVSATRYSLWTNPLPATVTGTVEPPSEALISLVRRLEDALEEWKENWL